MSELENLLQELDRLKEEIRTARETAPERRVRHLLEAIRLELNYTSNRIEGSTLTKEDTRKLTIEGPYDINLPNRPRKDIYEMITHDKIVLSLLDEEFRHERITQNFIKGLHKELMYEPFEKDKRAQIGKWKLKDNEIINYRSEKIDFTPKEEVPEEMDKLVNWLDGYLTGGKKQEPLHPVLLAAEFHLRYVTIHPFYDGNGRTARILTNIILNREGYPPFIVTEDDKHAYYVALAHAQAYEKQPEQFYAFVARQLQKTSKLYLQLLTSNEPIEETTLDDRIAFLKGDIETHLFDIPFNSNPDLISRVRREFLEPFFEKLSETVRKFDSLFLHNGGSYLEPLSREIRPGRFAGAVFLDSLPIQFQRHLFSSLVFWNGYKRKGAEFGMWLKLMLCADQFTFDLTYTIGPNPDENDWLSKLSQEEMNQYLTAPVSVPPAFHASYRNILAQKNLGEKLAKDIGEALYAHIATQLGFQSPS